jgi:hypothetical protein
MAFIGAFMSVLLFLLVQEPYELNFKAQDSTIAHMEMHIVKDYEITSEGVNSIINAKRAMRFEDRDEFYGIDGVVRNRGLINTLRANKATSRGDEIMLDGDVYYVRSDDFTLKSERILYHRSQKELSSDTFFVATYGPHKSEGEGFIYKIEPEILEAWNIHANLEMEKL